MTTSVLLIFSLASPVHAAKIKAGAKCSEAGITATASGKKFTCIKSGKKLVWNKGVLIRTKKATAKPADKNSTSTTPISPPQSEVDFDAWSTNIDAKKLSDQAQRKFLSWVQSRAGDTKNHLQLIQDNPHGKRIAILKKADDLSAELFSSFFPQGSVTVIGATESWTVTELNKSGWAVKNCSDSYMSGVTLCLDSDKRQGYVVTKDATYSASNPGNDGAALLAHEYFHLVQRNLAKTRPGEGAPIKGLQADSVNSFPAWFVEGTAEFVGYSVGALSQNASYWDGRPRMLSYSPPEESINKNAISDYEIRTCCGNNSPTYPYHIGQIATEFIVASVGFQKMLDIWIDFASTRNFEKSFEAVTGISKASFYEKFELLRPKVGLPPVTWKLEGVTNRKIGN